MEKKIKKGLYLRSGLAACLGSKAFAEGYPFSQKQRNRPPILCFFICVDCNWTQSNILFAHPPGTQEEPIFLTAKYAKGLRKGRKEDNAITKKTFTH